MDIFEKKKQVLQKKKKVILHFDERNILLADPANVGWIVKFDFGSTP